MPGRLRSTITTVRSRTGFLTASSRWTCMIPFSTTATSPTLAPWPLVSWVRLCSLPSKPCFRPARTLDVTGEGFPLFRAAGGEEGFGNDDSPACQNPQNTAFAMMGNINIYDIYADVCVGDAPSTASSRVVCTFVRSPVLDCWDRSRACVIVCSNAAVDWQARTTLQAVS